MYIYLRPANGLRSQKIMLIALFRGVIHSECWEQEELWVNIISRQWHMHAHAISHLVSGGL